MKRFIVTIGLAALAGCAAKKSPQGPIGRARRVAVNCPACAHTGEPAPTRLPSRDDRRELDDILGNLRDQQRRMASSLAQVEIDVVDGRVYLRGQVLSEHDRTIIEDVVLSVNPYLVIDDHELQIVPDPSNI
jgi:hypothetical protein